MENIEIKINSALMNYRLFFDNRVNILRGDSATGKSFLLRLLDNRRNSKIDIQSTYKLFHINIDMILNGLPLNDDTVYILDEGDGIENSEIVNLINKSRFKFLLITRESDLENVNYGIHQIYNLHQSGKYNISKPSYDYDLNNRLLNTDKIVEIVTEDSKSGFEYYYNYNNFSVVSSFGNSNINKYIKDNQIVVIDSLAYGPFIKSLVDISKNRNIFLIYPKSFEWLILTSKIFNIPSSRIYELYEKSINQTEEKFYEKFLDIESNRLGMRYSKSKLNIKFIENGNFEKINQRVVDLFNINLIELNSKLNNKNDYWSW